MTGHIDPKRLRTLNGRYSSLCNLCGDAVYSLWIDDADPEGKCVEGVVRVTDCQQAMGMARTRAGVPVVGGGENQRINGAESVPE